jgi:hypothetical protein
LGIGDVAGVADGKHAGLVDRKLSREAGGIAVAEAVAMEVKTEELSEKGG